MEDYTFVWNRFWSEKNWQIWRKLKKIAWYPSKCRGSLFQVVTYLFFKWDRWITLFIHFILMHNLNYNIKELKKNRLIKKKLLKKKEKVGGVIWHVFFPEKKLKNVKIDKITNLSKITKYFLWLSYGVPLGPSPHI